MAPAPILRRVTAVAQQPLGVAAYRQAAPAPMPEAGALAGLAPQTTSAYQRGPARSLGHFLDCYA